MAFIIPALIAGGAAIAGGIGTAGAAVGGALGIGGAGAAAGAAGGGAGAAAPALAASAPVAAGATVPAAAAAAPAIAPTAAAAGGGGGGLGGLSGLLGSLKGAPGGAQQLGFQLGQKLGLAQQGAPILPGSLPTPPVPGGGLASSVGQAGAAQNPLGLTLGQAPAPSSFSPLGASPPQVPGFAGGTPPFTPDPALDPGLLGGEGGFDAQAAAQILSDQLGAQQDQGGGGGGAGASGLVPVPTGGSVSLPGTTAPVPASGAEGFGGAGQQLSGLLPTVADAGTSQSNLIRRLLAQDFARRILGGGGGGGEF